ncbi:MAG: ATP-binding cassette domain-containing protein [Sulfurovum sp.]|nr:ATP-binding cassette domain-containing protein [Sulfurovum sp.]
MIHIDISKNLHGTQGAMVLEMKVNIETGSFVALSGSSGSGKTTFLRILAGLEKAEGRIKVDDEVWLDAKTIKPTQQREIGFVFQEYALFPNMTVEEHLLFVQKDKKLAKELLEITQLTSLAKRLPSTLSGGQQQRVNLCRAMMRRPKLLLMDEPLSALDVKMRMKLQNEILSLHKLFNTTTIMVSHDPSEIYHMAKRVIVLDAGKVIDDGNPKDVLLKTSGSAKFAFEGELIDIIQVDIIYIAIIAIGQQLTEIVVSHDEIQNLTIGQKVSISTKAFSPLLKSFNR